MKRLFTPILLLFVILLCSEKEYENPAVKNLMIVAGKTYELSQAVIVENRVSKEYEGEPWYNVVFLSEYIEYETGNNWFTGAVQVMDFEINTPEKDEVSNGVYLLNPNSNDDDFEVWSAYYMTRFNSDSNEDDEGDFDLIAGKLEVNIDKNKGTIEFNGVDENGMEVKGYYSGAIPKNLIYEFKD